MVSSFIPGGAQSPASNASVIAGITTELDRLATRIDIRANQIKILEGPSDFYETLKTKIRGAKKRIFLSSLYIGKSEHELVLCLRHALEKNSDLKVSILTDALRGTRETPEPSCASLLAPLAADFPSQVEIRMYHTPNLTGWRKRMLPKRINEGWGLQHMKLYGFDDEIILSGANLSSDYFTNRQDRYHVFSSKRVTDYYSQIHSTMCRVSFLLRPLEAPSTYALEWPAKNAVPSPLVNPKDYISKTTELFRPLVRAEAPGHQTARESHTIIYPMLTLPHSLNNELPALKALLSTPLPQGSSYLFTAGYFNPHPVVITALLACSSNQNKGVEDLKSACVTGTVLTASPWANGFFGSKGVSGMLPAAYTLLSRRFLQRAVAEASGTVEFREWRRGTVGTPGGWTYHAKGLWLTLPESSSYGSKQNYHEDPHSSPGPSLTIIGSSNYTSRSYSLDTEVGAVIVTTDKGLEAELKKEADGLLRYSKIITEEDLRGSERRVGIGVRIAMWIVKILGGSL